MNKLDFLAKPSLEVLEIAVRKSWCIELKKQAAIIPGLPYDTIIKGLLGDISARFMRLSEEDKAIACNYIIGYSSLGFRGFCEHHLGNYPEDAAVLDRIHSYLLQLCPQQAV